MGLILSGCALLDGSMMAPTEEKPNPAAAAPPAAPPPAATVARLPPPSPPPRPRLDAQMLVGLGEDDVTKTLGQPGHVRNDPPAMVWSYQVNGCALDLFFYLDLKTQDFRALAYSFESGGATDSAKQTCLFRIQEASRDRRR